MKVGIRFSDNDFMNEIETFIELFLIPNFIEREGGHMITHLTSSQIVEMFNRHMPYVYAYEKKNRSIYPQDFDFVGKIGKYLQITEFNVYWDDKTDDFVGPWELGNGGEFLWIKLHLQ